MTEPAAPDPDLPDAGPGTCTSCGAALAPEQDWCLACGAASESRIGRLPGLRTAAKVGALTLVLVGCAVAASYAALNHGSKTTVVASVPVKAPPAATSTSTTATTPTATQPPTTTAAPVSPPIESTPTVPPGTFTTDTIATTPVVTVDTTTTPTTTTPTTTTTTTTTTTPAKTTPATPKPVAIKLGKNSIAVYDPMSRVQSHTDPAAAIDGDQSTVFTLNTAPSSDGPQAGFTIDLGKAQLVTKIKIQTPTPGFGGLVYGATGPHIPTTLTDPAWKHLRNFSSAGSANGTATITLGKKGAGVSSYRYLMLWITNPPSAAPGTRDAPASTDATSTTTPATATTSAAPTTTPPTTPPTAPPTTTQTTTATTPATTPPLAATISIAELSVFN